VSLISRKRKKFLRPPTARREEGGEDILPLMKREKGTSKATGGGRWTVDSRDELTGGKRAALATTGEGGEEQHVRFRRDPGNPIPKREEKKKKGA